MQERGQQTRMKMQSRTKVTSRTHREKEEKRQPTQDEHPHNDGEGFGSLFLPGKLHEPHWERTSKRMVFAAFGAAWLRVLQHATTVYPEDHFHRLVSLSFHTRLETVGSPAGHYIDPKIHDKNYHKWQVEGEEGRKERVARLLCDPTDAFVHRRRFLPSQKRSDRDDCGWYPH